MSTPAGSDVDEEILRARALLARVVEPTCIPVWMLVRAHGPVAAVAALRDGSAGDLSDGLRERMATADPDADLDAAARHGVRLVVPESADWPHFALSCLENTGLARAGRYERGDRTQAQYGEPIPPLALWVRGVGDLAGVGTRAVGIVGARCATRYGEQVAADLAYGLARRGYVVVSGGAYGIDAAAHRGALGAGGETVVVSAGGLDRAYPPTHADLFDRAAASGLVVSESPPGAAPHRRRFLTRNRLIAALSGGTIVVEASSRSGAVNTAGHAARLDRPLMVVPGPVTSAQSAGCHALLRSEKVQANLITSVDDVLSLIGTASDLPAEPPAATVDDVRQVLDGLDEAARIVYDGLPARRSVTVGELAAAAGLPPQAVVRALPALELARLVVADRDGGYRRLRPVLSGVAP